MRSRLSFLAALFIFLFFLPVLNQLTDAHTRHTLHDGMSIPRNQAGIESATETDAVLLSRESSPGRNEVDQVDRIWPHRFRTFEIGHLASRSTPPIANAGPGICNEIGGSSVQVDGSGSHDPDGVIVQLIWDWGDGEQDTVINPLPGDFVRDHDYGCSDIAGCDGIDNDGDGNADEVGPDGCDESYRITLQAKDNEGLIAMDTTGVSFCHFQVLSVDPGDGETGVDPAIAAIRLLFSQPPDPASLALGDAGLFLSVDDEMFRVPVVVEIGLDPREVSLIPDSPLIYESTYVVLVTPDVENEFGSDLDQFPCTPEQDSFWSSFTTGTPGACFDVLTCDCFVVMEEGDCSQNDTHAQFKYQGLGTSCPPNPGSALGACCFPDGCLLLSCGECVSVNLYGFLGPETSCVPDLCGASGIESGLEASFGFCFSPPAPNPITDETILSFELPEPAEVELSIFDARGQRVTVVVDGSMPAGRHRMTWSGRSVLPGVYFARLRAGEFEATERWVVLR